MVLHKAHHGGVKNHSTISTGIECLDTNYIMTNSTTVCKLHLVTELWHTLPTTTASNF
jgi:hypothetical protein